MIPVYKKEVKGHMHAGSPATPVSYYYGDEDAMRPPAPEDVEAKLKREQKTTVGRLADAISQEVEDRRRMIGGVDNFWLQLSDVANFNPVGVGGPRRTRGSSDRTWLAGMHDRLLPPGQGHRRRSRRGALSECCPARKSIY